MTGTSPTAPAICQVDAAIVGGGAAGLWLARLLDVRGYRAVLLEADHLGGVQSLASQGIIHGGIKYALGGRLTAASEAISAMPQAWRDCLAGTGDVDLRGLAPLAESSCLFAGPGALGSLTAFLASRSLSGRISRLARADYPEVFRQPGFAGVVYQADDLVLDVPSLVRRLAADLAGRCYRWQAEPNQLHRGPGSGVSMQLGQCRLHAKTLILAGGAGNQALLEGLALAEPRQQLRPLQQVLVRHRHPHALYGHCLSGIRRPEPRLTITSHPDGEGWLWYLGGQLATDGADLSEDRLIDRAREELAACVPWLDWRGARYETLRVDRAEPQQSDQRRPDTAFAERREDVVVCWPTKLSLLPDLGRRLLSLMPPPQPGLSQPVLPLPAATPGRAPWSR